MAARREVTAAVATRYRAAGRREKGRILDELCAAMVGIADARLRERNCLCVIPKVGQTVTLAEMVAFLEGEVADDKLPEELLHVEELPFTATGKLRRHVLSDQVAKRLGNV